MFVLSPSVATTAASASCDRRPARARRVHAVADDEAAPPVAEPASASSSSSTHVTSQPSRRELLRDRGADPAAADHDRLHGRSVAERRRVMRAPRRRPRGRRRRAPRTARCGARGRRSARRSATAAASAATSRARSGRRRAVRASSTIAWPIERARTISPCDLDAVLLAERPRLRERRLGALARRRRAAGPRAGSARGTRTTMIASTVAPRSLASAIAVATISSPMSPSFIGTSSRVEVGAGRERGDRDRRRPARPAVAAPADEHETTSPTASQAGPGVARAGVGDHREHPDGERQRRADERRQRHSTPADRISGRARNGRSRSGSCAAAGSPRAAPP